jgi:hypothetical protein
MYTGCQGGSFDAIHVLSLAWLDLPDQHATIVLGPIRFIRQTRELVDAPLDTC